MTPAELKSLRSRLGYTQAQLAEAVGVTISTVWRWEHEQRNPSKTAVKLMQTLEKVKSGQGGRPLPQ